MSENEQPVSSSPSSVDDEDLLLLQRSNSGDRGAFRLLYSKYYHSILRFVFGITGRLDTAQEGVNDVMLVVWTNGKSFSGRSKVRTWIMGIAYRKALKLHQSTRRWQERYTGIESDDWNELSDLTGEPSRKVESLDALEHALRKLPPKQRAVVELAYRYGYSYEEIAAVVECPVNTVKTRMFHARANLQRVAPELYDR
jgi:RNA polymerase sigma factor (sigma-70 family)